MKRRLYLTAFITSPIIALYGAAPFYIFDRLSLSDVLKIGIGITAYLLCIWTVHILYIRRFQTLRPVLQFLIAYVVGTLLQGTFITIGALLNATHPPVEKYYAYPLLTSFAINAIVMVIANAIVTSYRKIAVEKEVQELRIQAGEAQRQVLMQQLQPHFLFNSLSVLKSLIGENAEAAQDYSVKLSGFLRYSAQAHRNDVVALQEELKFTHDYLDLQRVRFDGAFQCDIHIPDAAMDLRIPVFALQTLVENAFKHNHFTEKSPLHIGIAFQEGKLSVWNNVVSVKLTERSQTGLQNLNKRYLLIAGEGIEVFRSAAEFRVTIPLLPA